MANMYKKINSTGKAKNKRCKTFVAYIIQGNADSSTYVAGILRLKKSQ